MLDSLGTFLLERNAIRKEEYMISSSKSLFVVLCLGLDSSSRVSRTKMARVTNRGSLTFLE